MEAASIRPRLRQRATLVNSRSRETRTALIRAAMSLWGQDDFDAAFSASTAADIARAAGVSKGTFYFHFPSKEAILLELSSGTVQAMIDQVEAGAADGVPVHTLGEQMMSSMARRVARTPKAAALRACAVGFAARTDGTMAGPRLNLAFEALVRYGTDRREIGTRVDAEEAAAMMAAVAMEAIVRWARDDRPQAWLAEALRRRVGVVLRGIGPADHS